MPRYFPSMLADESLDGWWESLTADNTDSLVAQDISMMRARLYAARAGAPNRARALQRLSTSVHVVNFHLPTYRRSHAIRGMKVPELISLRD